MKRKGLFTLLLTGFVLFFLSCSKLNSPTELGDELIPAVDNINTFDTTLAVETGYYLFQDSTRHLLGENMALGKLVDPVFGTSTGDLFFNLSSEIYGASPFYRPDSVLVIDSVVLQLEYRGAYGDTTGGTQLTVQVAEIQKDNGFVDTLLYRYDVAPFSTGSSLGTATFSIPQLKDSQLLIRKRDTTKVANVLRIRLNNSLGQRLSQFDTLNNGAYKSDSLFRSIFRGLAVKTTSVNGPGALAYFNLYSASSGLAVYYQVKRNGVTDTASAVFRHKTYSQANSVQRIPGGEYLANRGKPSPQQVYIQSSPEGSYASVFVPGLTNFPNKIIHRAELVAYKVPSTLDHVFTPPSRLFLDHKGTSDTAAFIFDNDIQAGNDGSFNLGLFGGHLLPDNSYRFNITRYIQGIVTRKDRNDTLRIYAPLRTVLFSALFGQRVSVPVLGVIANGRVVLAGASHPDPARRLRLRIIYSNL